MNSSPDAEPAGLNIVLKYQPASGQGPEPVPITSPSQNPSSQALCPNWFRIIRFFINWYQTGLMSCIVTFWNAGIIVIGNIVETKRRAYAATSPTDALDM
jgi:hypothetical protein